MGDTFTLTQVAASQLDLTTNVIEFSGSEEKELKRVFDLLSDFSKKVPIQTELKDLEQHLFNAQKKIDAQVASGLAPNASRVDNNLKETLNKVEQLKNEIKEMEMNPLKKISVQDVSEMLKRLGHKVQRSEIEEMIWVVDEDLDMALNWNELKLMYARNLADKTGLEPSKMYHLVQFLIYDKNENGMVSVDETMNMLYARYGRSLMEVKLKEMFGEDLRETGREGGEIKYSRFIRAVERTQMSVFWRTTKGRLAATRGGLKKVKGDNEDKD